MTIHRERLCTVPVGHLQGLLLPMIEVDTATERDYVVRSAAIQAGTPETPGFSGDCADLKTFIWSCTHKSRPNARRIARDLNRDGVAVLYPFDDVIVITGRRHQVFEVGTAVLTTGGASDAQ